MENNWNLSECISSASKIRCESDFEFLSINAVREFIKRKKISPEELHLWYLEAVKKLKPESFNSNANKDYSELTEEQKFIDKFIADKINEKQDKLAGASLI